MATQFDLTTEWCEISDGSGFMAASIQGRGEVSINDADSIPDADCKVGHKIVGGGSFSYGGSKPVYARAIGLTADMNITVTQVDGGGLSGLTALAFVSVSIGSA